MFLTLPGIILGLALRVGGPQLAPVFFLFGLIPVVGFCLALYAFTTTTFRPGNGLAWTVVALATTMCAFGVAGTAVARISAWDVRQVVGGLWNACLILPFVMALVWTGVESQLHYQKLRRRLALDLADPVIVNRLLLWSCGSLGAVLGILVTGVSLVLGLRLVEHPAPMLGMAFAGITLSVSWALAFQPPAWYVDRLRSQHA